MNMAKWVADTIASPAKKGFPVLSFPAIQKMDVAVKDLIGSADLQAEAMRLVAESTPSAASVSFMDLSVEAESFGSRTVFRDDGAPTVVGSVVGTDADMDALAVPEATDGRCGLYVDAVRKAVPLIGDRPVFAGTIGPFSLAALLCGVNEIMLLCYDEPEFVESLLEKVSAFLVEYARAFKEAGADGVVMAEPLAGVLSPAMMEEFFAQIVDTEFTAKLEDQLDEVEEGKLGWKDILRAFYPPFEKTLEKAEAEIEKVEVKDEPSDVPCDKCGAMMVYKMGRFGRFLACPNFPDCRNTKPIVTYIDAPCPKCGGRLMEKTSKKNRKFYGCEHYPQCDFVSWEKPVTEKCPQCGSYMIEKRSRKGEVWHLCANETCRCRVEVPSEEQEEE